MADTVWGGLHVPGSGFIVTGIGAVDGPPGGDGWQFVTSLPSAQLPAGTNKKLAFVVSGTVRNIQTFGGTPQYGMCQVALGDASGLINPHFCQQVGLIWPTTAVAGVPFQFLVVFDPTTYSITDPAWGSLWPNVEDLAIYARVYTNGDVQNYGASFEVVDASFLWFNLDEMTGSQFHAAQHYPGVGLVPLLQTSGIGSFTNHFQSGNQPGAAGEKWLHFVNLWFTPYASGAHFQHYNTTGAYPTGFAIKLGESAWGCRPRGPAPLAGRRSPAMHFGAFKNQTRPSGTLNWGYRGSGLCDIYRWRYLGVRLDELPDLHQLSQTGLVIAAHQQEPPPPVLHEVPPISGMASRPTYLTTSRAYAPAPGLRAFRARVQTNRGLVLNQDSGAQVDGIEGVPVFTASTHGLGRGEGARYETRIIRHQGEGVGTIHRVDDLEFVQVWLLKDPSVNPPDPGSALPPVIIVPGREGVSIAAQLPLPIQPSAAFLEEAEEPMPEILGIAGVRRTWPLFTGPRRFWGLDWPALRNDEKEDLDEFLRANPTFKWRPPQESGDAAMLAMEPAGFQMIDPANWTWSLRLRAAELVFVGGA